MTCFFGPAESLGSIKRVLPTAIALLALPLAAKSLAAQEISSAATPSFEVASLKPVQLTPGLYRANLGTASHGEVVLTNVTLSDCLKFAYGITNDAQIVGPDWIRNRDVRFDIQGKAAANTPREQLLAMFQTLLTERFKLILHRERRGLTVLALVTGKNGPKFSEARNGSDGSHNRVILGAILSNRITMPVLATLLSRFLREPVLDETGLNGSYEVTLEWTTENKLPASEAAGTESHEGPAPPDHPSIFEAVQEQLGLKLERRRSPLEVIVVDHADRTPVAN